MQRKNFVAFACGKRESGKSYLLARYAKPFPRRIIHDAVGECIEEYENAYVCGTLRETLHALESAATKSSAWTIVTCIDPGDVPAVFRVLAPVGSIGGGLSRAVGGVLVMTGEVDTIAPNNAGIAPEVRNVFQRGRHYRVSMVCATQRPRDVHRVVTSQADAIILFRQHELRDLEYISKLTSDAVRHAVRALPLYSHVRYLPSTSECQIIDPSGAIVRRVDVFGDGAGGIETLTIEAENDAVSNDV